MINFLKKLFLPTTQSADIAMVEPISIIRGDGSMEENILAFVDTTQEQSFIDESFAKQIGVYDKDLVIDRVPAVVTGGSGREKLHDQIEISFKVAGIERRSKWLIADRSDQRQVIALGKGDVRGLKVLIPEMNE